MHKQQIKYDYASWLSTANCLAIKTKLMPAINDIVAGWNWLMILKRLHQEIGVQF